MARREGNGNMEFNLSGDSLKTFARGITCLARVGTEVAFQASSSQLACHTLNASRSAYQSIIYKSGFFNHYTINGVQIQCSVLLKAICSVLRTPISSVNRLSVRLLDPDASKVLWELECNNGMKKSYWINCNVEPDIQLLSLDKGRFPSNLVVRPRDLNRLLSNFQSSLQEITVIATETCLSTDVASEVGGKAVELRSYIDPLKEADALLHTQLWIDPTEEFVHYAHNGNPVDVTFGVKELKAFLSFCEGCEVDIHLFFEKAGEPILLAPKFGLDDGSSSNFDATLVLATMLVSQLYDRNPSENHAPTTNPAQPGHLSDAPVERNSGNQSVRTRIWSDLSGSATRNVAGPEQTEARGEENLIAVGQHEKENCETMRTSKDASTQEHVTEEINGQILSQRHPSNWVDAMEEDDDGEEADDNELCVHSTPVHHHEP